MRFVECVKIGDILNIPDQDGLTFFGLGSKLPKTIMKFIVVKVYPFYVDTICKATGIHKTFTLGDLVMTGYEPSVLFNLELPRIGGNHGRNYYK